MKALELEDPEIERLTSNPKTKKPIKKAEGGSNGKKWAGLIVFLAVLCYFFLLVDDSPPIDGVVLDKPQPSVNQPASPAPPTMSAPNPPDPPKNTPPPPAPAPDIPALVETDTKGFVYANEATIPPNPYHKDPPNKEELIEKFGKWHFWDGDADLRPGYDYTLPYPNRDIPGEHFPEDAWQADAVYVNHILNDGEELISRTMEAMFVEYGKGKPMLPELLVQRLIMYRWDLIEDDATEPPEKYQAGGTRGGGGWATHSSFDGLVRRLLHAMMVNEPFVIALLGDAAAAGYGNHFHQSYMMQVHELLAPMFARLGVQLVTRNLAQPSGSLDLALGYHSLVGDDVDLLLWDAESVEANPKIQEFVQRQALLSKNKIPVIWGGNFEVLRFLVEHAAADVGAWGNGMDGIKETTSENFSTIPWAARCLKPVGDACASEPLFCTQCWIDRDDVDASLFTQPMSMAPPGQDGSNPGWRAHHLLGRTIAYGVLDALQVAVQQFSDGTLGGPPLDEDYWHVTEHYNNIREKANGIKADQGTCGQMTDLFPARVCTTPMRGATQHTPRTNPQETSISSLVKASPSGYIPKNTERPMYYGDDVHNTCYDVREGIDVYTVASARRLATADASDALEDQVRNSQSPPSLRRLDAVATGEGWEVRGSRAGRCDGEYNSICGRESYNTCPLAGYHDGQGLMIGNEFAGWLVMELPMVEHGIIMIRLASFLGENDNPRTATWSTVNNQRRLRSPVEHGNASQMERLLRFEDVDPATFAFEYTIDGAHVSMNKDDFFSHKKSMGQFDLLTLLDDEGFTSEPKNVEIAIRVRGCGRACTLGLSHVYWA